jgi:DMSO/TMAO reductase YedYZ molybdopterin-dependent catalytic subunit
MNSDESASGIPDGLIVREKEPPNLESSFHQLNGVLTPNHLFYVRNHFPIPQINLQTYRLAVGGAVRNPFSIGYEELRTMPSETRTVTLECAGNGRTFLVPRADGVQWQLGAIGTAEWTGVPLPELLHRAGIAENVCEILFESIDKGVPKEEPLPPGEISFARSIPIALARETLIAYSMNGEDLLPEHGSPVRAIVPGQYGMASVKWLSEIRALARPFCGYFQTTDYAYWGEDESGNPERIPLRELAVKSQIARPFMDEVIAAGCQYRVFGAAWSTAEVEAVEFSADDGQSWRAAQFIDPPQPHVWRRWQFDWKVPTAAGGYTLKSRATDSDGKCQPDEHDQKYGAYRIHHVLPVKVLVR